MENAYTDIRGQTSPGYGNITLDNYNDRTIYEEFFHSFQVHVLKDNSYEVWQEANAWPTVSNRCFRVELLKPNLIFISCCKVSGVIEKKEPEMHNVFHHITYPGRGKNGEDSIYVNPDSIVGRIHANQAPKNIPWIDYGDIK